LRSGGRLPALRQGCGACGFYEGTGMTQQTCVSEMVVSANFREWRHIFKLRVSAKAQWEIRKACRLMLAVLKEHAGACFDDVVAEAERASA